MKTITIRVVDKRDAHRNAAIIKETLKKVIEVSINNQFYELSHYLGLDDDLAKLKTDLFKVIDNAEISD